MLKSLLPGLARPGERGVGAVEVIVPGFGSSLIRTLRLRLRLSLRQRDAVLRTGLYGTAEAVP